jgi:hypothetical protein
LPRSSKFVALVFKFTPSRARDCSPPNDSAAIAEFITMSLLKTTLAVLAARLNAFIIAFTLLPDCIDATLLDNASEAAAPLIMASLFKLMVDDTPDRVKPTGLQFIIIPAALPSKSSIRALLT